jgi:hypothetical protein
MGNRGWNRGSEQRAVARKKQAAAKLAARQARRRQVALSKGGVPLTEGDTLPGPRPGAPRDPRDTTATRSPEAQP